MRDRLIMSNVPKYQNVATMVALCGWMILFLSIYGGNDKVPSWLVAVMIGSLAFVSIMAQPVGALIAYRLANREGTKP